MYSSAKKMSATQGVSRRQSWMARRSRLSRLSVADDERHAGSALDNLIPDRAVSRLMILTTKAATSPEHYTHLVLVPNASEPRVAMGLHRMCEQDSPYRNCER